ncbi:hypothetical protein C6P45_003687 [Maudiozyma exigua]|uniref:Uncharacterized protein n=1 Tax=Maudiozyma exigua TaxID=34358 RepID=A0A9P6WGN9_MAUEX|nr:hypothetical protein C6P45_003687 [Kazachstania exigua]
MNILNSRISANQSIKRLIHMHMRYKQLSNIRLITKRYISTSKDKELDPNDSHNENSEQPTSTNTKIPNKLTADKLRKNSNNYNYSNSTRNNLTTLSHKTISNTPKYTSVPKVPTTEYISIADIETEGLFAGYRPLFLGKSTLEGSEYFSKYDTNSILSSISSSKLVDMITKSLTDPGKSSKLKNILDEFKNEEFSESNELSATTTDTKPVSKRKTPIIPWDASIGGLVYSNDPFKNVPKKVVTQLKPFEPLTNLDTKKGNSEDITNSMIVMKVHNPRINDDLEMVNLFDKDSADKKLHYRKYNNHNNDARSMSSKVDLKKLAQQRKLFQTEHKKLAYDHKFINDDQSILRSEIKSLLHYLSDIFYEQTGLAVYADTKTCLLPLNVYVQLTKSSGRSNRQFLRKTITDQIFPIYNTILATYENPTDIKNFKRLAMSKINEIIRKISETVPSVCFTDSTKSVDCLIRQSPVPGFKRMYWLKPHRRLMTFCGPNSNKEYTLKLKNRGSITRNGVRYMKYPNNLNCHNLTDAFDNWDYFTRL